MKLTPNQKKGIGIAVLIIFIPIQLLFLAVLISSLIENEVGRGETTITFLFTMGIFAFPLWWGFSLIRQGNSVLQTTSQPDTGASTGTHAVESTVTVRTKLELPEYRRVVFYLVYTTPAFLYIHLLAALFVAAYFLTGGANWFAFFFVAFVIYLPIGVYFNAASNYKSTKMLHEEVTYQFSPESFTAIGESFTTTIQWKSLYKVREKEKWFLLYTNKQMAMVIPKAVFPTVEDVAVVRGMAMRGSASS